MCVEWPSERDCGRVRRRATPPAPLHQPQPAPNRASPMVPIVRPPRSVQPSIQPASPSTRPVEIDRIRPPDRGPLAEKVVRFVPPLEQTRRSLLFEALAFVRSLISLLSSSLDLIHSTTNTTQSSLTLARNKHSLTHSPPTHSFIHAP